MLIRMDFPHSYQLEPIEDLPGTGKVPQFIFGSPYFKPPPRAGHERSEGLLLRIISPGKQPWIAVVKGSFDVPGSGVYATFDPEKFCVVAGGYGCFVNAANPEEYEGVHAYPVTDVRIIEDRSMFVFADFIRICAYDRAGLMWKSPRVCWDELKIVSINGNTINGTGYDPTNSINPLMRFSVDLKTGQSLLPLNPSLGN
jgi:hypothetical protein